MTTLAALKEPRTRTTKVPSDSCAPRRRAVNTQPPRANLPVWPEATAGPIFYAGLAAGWAVEFLVSMNEKFIRIFQPGQALSLKARMTASFWDQVEEMRWLQDDWNGYGSEAPNEFARENAKEILLTANGIFVPSRVSPSAQGGVGICFIHGQRYADIECLNSGEVVATTSDGKSVPDVWEVKPSESAEALKRIARFIHP